jgi:hypothetical protein
MVLSYFNQSSEYINKLVAENESVLICLDSGESFRQNIYSGYRPSDNKFNFERPKGVKFLQIKGLEAEDIVALYKIKNKIPFRKNNYNMMLTGDFKKGVPSLIKAYTFYKIGVKYLIKADDPYPKIKKLLTSNHKISEDLLNFNYYLTSKELNVYMNHLKNFDKIYAMI